MTTWVSCIHRVQNGECAHPAIIPCKFVPGVHSVGRQEDEQLHCVAYVGVRIHELAVRCFVHVGLVGIRADVGECTMSRSFEALAANVEASHAYAKDVNEANTGDAYVVREPPGSEDFMA